MGAITWRKTGVYVLVALPVLGLAGITVIAQQQQDASQQTEDPVAAAARKAREQKKAAPKPKKVYTNEDVSSGAAAPAAPAATGKEEAAAAGEAKTTEGGEAKPENAAAPGKNKNDEATWRARFKEVRQKLADTEKELDILQREANKAQNQYYTDPQKAMTEQYSRKDINEHDAQIAAKKEEVAKLKQQLSDMEDELRKSGGELGWSRE